VLEITVPAAGSLTVSHGLRSNDLPVRPTLIQPDQAVPVYVDSATVNTLTATFINPGAAPYTFRVRFERGLSNELDADTVGVSYWQGNPGSAAPTVPSGEVPAPGGPYPAIPANTPVGIAGGVLVPADGGVAAIPAIGFYTGAATNYVRTDGIVSGYVGLPADADIYLADGGGVSGSPPVGAGKIAQKVGQSVGTTSLFVSIQASPTYL
jgi:hypothetical protein